MWTLDYQVPDQVPDSQVDETTEPPSAEQGH